MNFYFHPDAEAEFEEATEYYEECKPGLGLDFAEEVYAAISRIRKFPEAWAELSANTRRCLTNRFPFGVIYQTKQNEIRIVAVANLHRRPNYWKTRA